MKITHWSMSYQRCSPRDSVSGGVVDVARGEELGVVLEVEVEVGSREKPSFMLQQPC